MSEFTCKADVCAYAVQVTLHNAGTISPPGGKGVQLIGPIGSCAETGKGYFPGTMPFPAGATEVSTLLWFDTEWQCQIPESTVLGEWKNSSASDAPLFFTSASLGQPSPCPSGSGQMNFTNFIDLYIYPFGQPPTNNNSGDNGGQGNGCGPSSPPPNPHCPDCESCSLNGPPCGMATWQVSEPYTSLWLRDEPLFYQPSKGPRVALDLAFKETEDIIGINTNIFSAGKMWNCAWLSYVMPSQVSGCYTVYFPGGRQRTFYNPYDNVTDTTLSGNTNSGFTVSYPDGSQDIYDFVVTNSSGAFQQAFLTARINPQGQEIQLNYFAYNPAFPVIQLQNVVDADGRTNFISYAASNPYCTNLISQVTDPFGRTVSLMYDNNGHLTNITDVAGIISAFTYDASDLPTSLTTPYGTTAFSITTGITNISYNGRSVLITQPDGGHQLYLFTNNAPGIPYSYTSDQVPNTAPFANGFGNLNLNTNDSFYWGPRQYTALSTTNIEMFTANDFQKARMRHWLQNAWGCSQTISLEREFSPDSAGNIEGQKTWYDYYGKYSGNLDYEGAFIYPLMFAQVLPDGTTSFKKEDRNSLGYITDEIETYSTGGSVLLRTNFYGYAANSIDLITTTNALGIQVSSNYYNANHQMLTNYNALNEMTVYTYDASNRLTSTRAPNGLVTTNIYGSDGFLAQQIVTGFSTNSYTYTDALVATHTDTRGLATTNLWDNLNRLLSTTYPDGTTISNQYSALDLTGTKDRLGNWTYFAYDSMRRKIAETNALGAVTSYSYCTCGSLDFILDAAGNATHFYYDNQGNQTNVTYADGYSVTRTYDLLKRVVQTTDSGGNTVTNYFNNQGLQYAVSNAFGQVQYTIYDLLDRPIDTVDANGVEIMTSYDNLNRPIARDYPDGGVESWGYTNNVPGAINYTNQIGNVVRYKYDGMNRKTNEVYVGVTTNKFTYDGAGDLLSLTDGKNQATTWGYDTYGRQTNKVDAAGNTVFVYQYDANNRLTNRWTPAKGPTTYRYDALGNLTNVDYTGGTNAMSPVYLAYDVLNRLTNMVDGVGTNAYTYDAVGELLSEGGLWADDTVSYTYNNRLRTGLSLSQPSGSWSQSYGYDSMRRLTNVTSPAGTFGYGYVAQASSLPSGISLPNGSTISDSYDNVGRMLSTKLINSYSKVLDSQSYAYNFAGQRIAETNTAGDYRNYTYDNIGELKMAKGFEQGGATARLNEQYGYAYDAAGNLNYKTNNGFVLQFNVNNLNELTTNTRSGKFTVAGTTTAPATNVTVNTTNAHLYADATFAATNFTLINGTNVFTAIAKDAYGNRDTNTSAAILFATNKFSYDLNGNLLSDGQREFDYDDENQLIQITSTNNYKKEFVYDGANRLRVEKQFSWSGAWVETNEVRFIYDDNLIIQHRDTNNLPILTLTRGTDLSRSLKGAEGIGGLLAMTEGNGTNSYYHCDGNGNITCLIDTNQFYFGKAMYNPFGGFLSLSGSKANVNPYWFSSELYDDGFYHYPRRVYYVDLQRWLDRDPIGENGGFNLYSMIGNNPITSIDPYGTDALKPFFDVSLFNGHFDTQVGILFNAGKDANGCPNCKNVKLAQIVSSIYEDLAGRIIRSENWRIDSNSKNTPWYPYQQSLGTGVVSMSDDPGINVISPGQELYGLTQLFETCAVCLDKGPSVIGCVNWGQRVGGLRSASSWGGGNDILPVLPSADFSRLTGFY